MQGKWALVTVEVTPVQPQWVGCCQSGARSNKQPVQKGRRGSRRPMSRLLLADQISGGSQCRGVVGRAQDTRRQGQLPSANSPTA